LAAAGVPIVASRIVSAAFAPSVGSEAGVTRAHIRGEAEFQLQRGLLDCAVATEVNYLKRLGKEADIHEIAGELRVTPVGVPLTAVAASLAHHTRSVKVLNRVGVIRNRLHPMILLRRNHYVLLVRQRRLGTYEVFDPSRGYLVVGSSYLESVVAGLAATS
jgi:hypothetical protein